MSAEDMNLSAVRDLDGALSRTKNGQAAVKLASKVGLWTDELHSSSARRAAFPRRLSDLAPSELSDLYSSWTSEFGRVLEVCGALEGQAALLKVQMRSAEASARANVRRSATEGRSMTQQHVADLAAEAPELRDIAEQMAVVAVLNAHALAAKEATSQYLSTLSREISFRDAQMKARIY